MKKNILKIRHLHFCSLFLLPVLLACGEHYTPKPYGYFRIDLPSHAYRPLGDTLALPYTFDLSCYASVTESEEKDNGKKNPFWIDIKYPALNAAIFCSYKPVRGNLYELSEDAYRTVHKHDVRAEVIGEKMYENPEQHVFGLLYDLEGNTASNLQFVLTDSVRHFFRATVYFNATPNKDSIAPALDFVKADVVRLMESFRWKE